MNPISTATIPVTTNPAMMLIQHVDGGPISYASIHCDQAQAIDMLRRALIHLVAELHHMTTVPTPAAILANGHNPEPVPDSVPPLRVPKAKPTSAPTMRGKPGPKPGTARRRKADVDADLEF